MYIYISKFSWAKVNGKAYGVNGVGGGKMPGFGAVLPQSDIELVIDYLRGLKPDA